MLARSDPEEGAPGRASAARPHAGPAILPPMSPPRRPRRGDVLRLLALVVFAALAFAAVQRFDLAQYLNRDALRGLVDDLGWWALALYFGIWLVLNGLGAQTLLPTVSGGIMFGWFAGGLLAVAGATMACSAQYLLVRTVLRGPAERLLLERFPTLGERIEESGLGLLVLLRFIWFPTWMVNVACALTGVPLRRFVLAFPAMLPQAFLFCLISDSVTTWGWVGIPAARWGLIGGLIAASVLAYVVALKKVPALRALRRGARAAG